MHHHAVMMRPHTMKVFPFCKRMMSHPIMGMSMAQRAEVFGSLCVKVHSTPMVFNWVHIFSQPPSS